MAEVNVAMTVQVGELTYTVTSAAAPTTDAMGVARVHVQKLANALKAMLSTDLVLSKAAAQFEDPDDGLDYQAYEDD